MAEVATKKSLNVVSSNNKTSEVCSVLSNQSLIEVDNNLDNNKSTNNRLIALCDDDEEEDEELSRNGLAADVSLGSEDKSLQELIENELALRIRSTNLDPEPEQELEPEPESEPEPQTEPEVVVEEASAVTRQLDVNVELIAAEQEHYTLIEEVPYEYQNGVHESTTEVEPEMEQESVENPDAEETDPNASPWSPDVSTSSSSSGLEYGKSSQQKEEAVDEVSGETVIVCSNLSRDKQVNDLDLSESNDCTEELDDERENVALDASNEDPERGLMSSKEAALVDVNEKDCSSPCGRDAVFLREGEEEEEDHQDPPLDAFAKPGNEEVDNGCFTLPVDNDEECRIVEKNDIRQEETPEEAPQEASQDECSRSDESDEFENLEDSVELDELSSPIANPCCGLDAESREEVKSSSSGGNVTNSSLVTSSSSTTKTVTTTTTTTKKKKKIEGIGGSDASPNHTPRTKKTKKSKKSDLEKENISVSCNFEGTSMHTSSRRQVSTETIEYSDEDDLSNVNVKSLTQSYVSGANRGELEKSSKEVIATGVSIKQLCRGFVDISNEAEPGSRKNADTKPQQHERAKSTGDLRLCSEHANRDAIFTGVSVKALKSSFNKFDALSKKSVLHVRSVDAGKVQQQLNSVGQNGDANPNCRSCGKVVFQMERTKAEGLVWHKNCFRCVQCSKQLNVDNYESHESTLYCKPHFKELFLPKPVEESDQPVRPRKPELIIRENQPKELPPDVVRASDKPDLGLEELSALNVKSRFQVFEKANTETQNDIERSPSQVAVKRSPSILIKLAKFQAKGMDIGVSDETLNGIPYEESSESEEEVEEEETEEVETEIVKAKRGTREQPISFTKMDDIKNRWETTSQQGRRESQREARKEEIAGIRSRLFMGKQGKMKELYQQAVADSERVTKINAMEEIQHSTNARTIKERFERGEPIAMADDDEAQLKQTKQERPDEEVIAAGIGRKSRSLFLELDATAAKTGRPVTPVNPKPTETQRRARDAFMGRQVSDDVVRSTDTTEEVRVETSDISNKFKFFETYKEPEKQRKQFRITPPRDGQVKMDSPEREIYRDPEVVRADDKMQEVVRTDTARKMLSIFRQMEENATKEEVPEGPKPLKRFTPPPEERYAKATASGSEDEDDEEAEESEGEDDVDNRDPNYVRASDKVEDEFLKQAKNAARAKTLRAKFEHWETTDGKTTSHNVAEMEMAQGEQSSIESASSLRARFESLGSVQSESPRTPKVKVSRFVEMQTSCMDPCEMCQKRVYPLEKVETNNKIFHKQCFRCLHCNCILRMDTFTLNNGKLYCIPHFKQLFITRGNYDEGFGVDPHKNKWSSTSAANSPIVVSNGDL